MSLGATRRQARVPSGSRRCAGTPGVPRRSRPSEARRAAARRACRAPATAIRARGRSPSRRRRTRTTTPRLPPQRTTARDTPAGSGNDAHCIAAGTNGGGGGIGLTAVAVAGAENPPTTPGRTRSTARAWAVSRILGWFGRSKVSPLTVARYVRREPALWSMISSTPGGGVSGVAAVNPMMRSGTGGPPTAWTEPSTAGGGSAASCRRNRRCICCGVRFDQSQVNSMAADPEGPAPLPSTSGTTRRTAGTCGGITGRVSSTERQGPHRPNQSWAATAYATPAGSPGNCSGRPERVKCTRFPRPAVAACGR